MRGGVKFELRRRLDIQQLPDAREHCSMVKRRLDRRVSDSICSRGKTSQATASRKTAERYEHVTQETATEMDATQSSAWAIKWQQMHERCTRGAQET
eukprot:6193211-Pleurochrysis_carterae.AAC.1